MINETLYMGGVAFTAVLIENILRSSQSKNVQLGYKRAVFVTGGLMTLCDGLVMTLIAKGGFSMLPFTVVASALGWISGVYIHEWLTREHRAQIQEERKARKTRKREQRLKTAINKAFAERNFNGDLK